MMGLTKARSLWSGRVFHFLFGVERICEVSFRACCGTKCECEQTGLFPHNNLKHAFELLSTAETINHTTETYWPHMIISMYCVRQLHKVMMSPQACFLYSQTCIGRTVIDALNHNTSYHKLRPFLFLCVGFTLPLTFLNIGVFNCKTVMLLSRFPSFTALFLPLPPAFPLLPLPLFWTSDLWC